MACLLDHFRLETRYAQKILAHIPTLKHFFCERPYHGLLSVLPMVVQSGALRPEIPGTEGL